MVTVSLIVGILVLIVPAILSAVWLGSTFWQASASKNWLKAEGVVIESRLVSNRNCNGFPGYHYHVRYQFPLFGSPYEAISVRLGDFRYYSRSGAEKTLAQYPAGRPVTVHYQVPDDQAEVEDGCVACLLEPGLNRECLYPIATTLIIGFLLGAMLTGLAMNFING